MVDKANWIDAGLSALVRGGPEAVRVEPLAKALKVTKGSFYWHFRDRAALLAAIRTRWEEVATSEVIERVEEEGSDPRRRLDALFAYTTTHPHADRLEGAIRAWSTVDPATRRVTKRVDQRRLAYVSQLLEGLGFSSKEAKVRAKILYLALIGELSQVAHGGAPSERGVFATLVELVAGSKATRP